MIQEKIREQITNFEKMLQDGALYGTLTPESIADKRGNIHGLNIALKLLEDEPEVCPYDCDGCHDYDCPCDRLGCAGSGVELH